MSVKTTDQMLRAVAEILVMVKATAHHQAVGVVLCCDMTVGCHNRHAP